MMDSGRNLYIMDRDNLKLFRNSLLRVSALDGFYDSFYDRFMRQSDEIASIFQHRDIDQLKGKLRSTLEMVSQTAEGKPGLVLYLEMLGRTHQRLNVTRRHFEMWKTALIDTVSAYDPDFNESIGSAWEQVINMVIDRVLSVIERSRKLAS